MPLSPKQMPAGPCRIPGWLNPSKENLVAEYFNSCHSLELLKKKCESERGQEVLASCERHLVTVEELLDKKFSNVSLAWRLLHWVDEQLILVMDRDELSAVGRKLLQDLKMVALPEPTRGDYLVMVNEKVKALEALGQEDQEQHPFEGSKSQKSLSGIAQLFRMVLNAINDCVDDRFWDIWVRRFFATIYSLLLVAIAIVLLGYNYYEDTFCLTIYNILLVGAAGGLVSGIITTDQEYMSKGNFFFPTLYYTLVRPTIGAVSAVIIFWMVESQYLIRIEPPLLNCCIAPCNAAQSYLPEGTQVTAAPTAGGNAEAKEDSSVFTLRTKQGKQIYLYMLLLFVGGFSGDKVLKLVSCKMTSRLFAEAEKTKGAK